MLVQKILRPVVRASKVATRWSSSEHNIYIHQSERDGGKKWMILTAVVAVPMVAISYINAFHTDPEDHSPPEYVKYNHLCIRNKKFCWGDGDHSLLHNKQTNAVSEGYEEEFVHHH